MFRKSLVLVCCLTVLAVFFSPRFSAADPPGNGELIKVFNPTLEKIGLPTNLSQIPGGTVHVKLLGSDEFEVGVYSVVGFSAHSDQVGLFFELFVPAGVFFAGREVKRISFVTTPNGGGDWYVKVPTADHKDIDRIPVLVTFVLKPTS